jgi:hypothetical protein
VSNKGLSRRLQHPLRARFRQRLKPSVIRSKVCRSPAFARGMSCVFSLHPSVIAPPRAILSRLLPPGCEVGSPHPRCRFHQVVPPPPANLIGGAVPPGAACKTIRGEVPLSPLVIATGVQLRSQTEPNVWPLLPQRCTSRYFGIDMAEPHPYNHATPQ